MPPPIIVELQRRRVFRALVGYGVAAFAVLQIIEPIMHGLHWPDEVLSYVVVALAVGFPVVVSLAWIFDVNAGRVERTPPTAGLRGVAPLLVGLSLLAAAPGLYYYFVLRARRGPAAPAGVSVASIAVLPLVNMSRDPEQDYFADGLAEELLDLLAKVPGLHVAARTSAFSFKGKNEDVRTIAEKLNVATLLEGSVRKAGDQVRITTQLINAADGYHLWSETYDRKLTDVFAVQDEIARAVVAALRVRLLPGQALQAHRTAQGETYTDYLKGRQFLNLSNVEGWKQAAAAFEKAVASDPGFAPAWAGLAEARFWLADSASDTPAALIEGQRLALEAAEKAVALRPDLPEGYVARANIRGANRFDWDGARADFERALALSPEDADALNEYAGTVLRPLGKLDEAIAVSRKVAQLDPLNSNRWNRLGGLLVCAGRHDEAKAALNRSLEINPTQAFAAGWLGLSLILQGNAKAAFAVVARSTNEVFRQQGAALAHHALGQEKETQAEIAAMLEKHAHDGAYQIAGTFAFVGDKDRAFEWLERARAQSDGGLMLIQIDPLLRSVRGDPRYDRLLASLNLRRAP